MMMNVTDIKKSFDRTMFDSPLRKPKIGILVSLLLIFIIVGGVIGNVIRLGQEFYGISPLDEFRIYFIALGLSLLAALPALLLLSWLDRRTPEPWWVYLLALMWGGICGTGWVITLNFVVSVKDLLVMISGEAVKNSPIALSLAGALDAGFTEELTKAVGLLLLVWLLRSTIQGMRDGFVYGALVGLGFNIVECSIYIMMNYNQSGVPPYLSQAIVRYCFLGLDGHALYTGLVGLGIGFAIQTRRRWARLLVPLVFFSLAVLAHATWDALPTIGQMVASIAEPDAQEAAPAPATQPEEENKPNELDVSPTLQRAVAFWSELVGMTLITQWPFMLLAIILVIQSGRWIRQVLREELANEVETGAVTSGEYAVIQAGRMPAWRTPARAIYQCQAFLALRKQRLHRDGQEIQQDALLQAWREDIASLRTQ